MYNFRMHIGPSISGIETWDVYTYPGVVAGPNDTAHMNPEMLCREAYRRIQHLLIRDAWEPETLRGKKISIAFIDEDVFNCFVETLRHANAHNEFSVLLLDQQGHSVLDEVWFPGDYTRFSNISVFQVPAPIDDENEFYEDYEPVNTEDFE